GARKLLIANSGSSANLLAFSALTSSRLGDKRLVPGDEVISVAAGFPSTITPIIQNGCVPVFLDVSLPTYNVDVKYLEEAVSPRTRAVMLAHTLGNPFDLAAIKAFCAKHNLWLIEDNCDALGTEYFIDGEWKKTGSIGDMGTFSFYPPHHMTMGEGGAVCTSRVLLEKIILSFRDWGRDCWCDPGKDNTCGIRFEHKLGQLPQGYDHKYIYSHFGYNLKATDMQAAVGCAQLEKLPSFVEARIKNFNLLYEGLKDLEDVLILPQATANSKPSWFGFLLTVRKGARFTRNQIVAHLESKKIQTRMLFAGNFLRHPSFDEMRATGKGYRVIGDLSVTDQIMNDTFWVGVYPGRTQSEIDFMIREIRNFCRK
ncbi:MAG TPA: lipopolysaccharide biosynthesis protein RfbH, partial [Leptospiraceae bacterium]|nr:lipopolysaccharide biosynthesis protein RfbH [Leptospiraceae bacterium]